MSPLSLDLQKDYCFYCPKMCHFACPVSEASGNEGHSPGWLMTFFRMMGKKAEGPSPGAFNFYACSGCKRCQVYCLHGNDVAEAMKKAREKAFQRGMVPEGLQRKLEEERKKALPDSLSPAPLVLLDGCFSLSEKKKEWFLNFFKKWMPSHSIGFSEVCCGSSFLSAGDAKGLEKHSSALRSLFKSSPELLVLSAECACHLRKILGEGKKVFTLLEFLAEKNPPLTFSPSAGKPSIFLYASPWETRISPGMKGMEWLRQTLAPSISWILPPWKAVDSPCSGVGFGLEDSYPEIARRMALNLIEKVSSLGAEKMLVSCPRIASHLRSLEKIEILLPEELFEQYLS